MLDIAILDGVRTPFVKAFGPLAGVPAQDLGRLAASAALSRCGLRPDEVDQVVFGNVATPPDCANIARVIALRAGVPQDRIAHTVQRNCASGMEAISTAAGLIQLGEAKVVLAGGTESMSQIPLLYNRPATEQYMRLGRAKSFWQRASAVLGFRPRHFKPVIAVKLGLTDPVSGLIMGETAEVLVEEFGISRQAQDEFALLSHQRAVAAQECGTLAEEIVPVPADLAGGEIEEDVGPRKGQSLEALAKLKPFFRENGTVTVGNSCQITDGAAAVVVMPGEAARAAGRRPLGYLRGFAYAGCDPRRMGLGPAFATSKLLEKTGLSLRDIDLIELNEAFAAQVIANEKAFVSDRFAKEQLGRGQALGELERGKMNVNGGAIALGHPVGATGTRLVLTLLKELRRRGLRYGLATLCVGGGQGGAMLLEAA
ncbi:MAG TPA: thiolase family protein [Gemmataceae bacterium]|nr:thiolase family protein [Gemmataceae bacterium]